MRCATGLLCLFALLPSVAFAQSVDETRSNLGNGVFLLPSAQEIAQRAFSATVLLVMEDANGQPISLGSGFVLPSGEIATNLHVVEGAVRGYAKLVGQAKKHDIESVTGVDHERDLILLKVSSTGWPALAIGNSDGVQVGETVFAVGNPQGLEGTFSQGIVSSLRQIGTDKLLQITAPISPGSSGGPVLNERGDVIGVSVATFTGGQNLNFAIPANYLQALLDTPRTETTLEKASLSKAGNSIVADIGGSSTGGLVGNNFSYGYSTDRGISYSFSIINKLRESVQNIHSLIIFYDSEGSPLDAQTIRHPGVIEAGLAKRITGGVVHDSTRRLNAPNGLKPEGKIEIRILNFAIYVEPIAGPNEYVVKSGDTGVKIARATGVSIGNLVAANPDVNWASLKVGQKVKLPH